MSQQSDEPRLARYVHPGHRYDGKIGIIVDGNFDGPAILRFQDPELWFGPVFNYGRQGDYLEWVDQDKISE